MFGLGIWELLVILAIVLLIFGPKRLKSLGSDLGSAIKGFRSAVKEDEGGKKDKQHSDERVIEGEVDHADHTADTQSKSAHKQDSNV